MMLTHTAALAKLLLKVTLETWGLPDFQILHQFEEKEAESPFGRTTNKDEMAQNLPAWVFIYLNSNDLHIAL